jgi:hypothetical protein
MAVSDTPQILGVRPDKPKVKKKVKKNARSWGTKTSF